MLDLIFNIWAAFCSGLVSLLAPSLLIWAALCVFRFVYYIIGGIKSYD